MENENISVDELNQLLSQSPNQLFIIDLMSKEDFDRRHVPGAVNIPLEELGKRLSEIPANKTIVVSCTRGLMKSDLGLQQLQNSGFANVRKLTGGVNGWYELKAKV
jgi:rhodanese-related sulfurtransferase